MCAGRFVRIMALAASICLTGQLRADFQGATHLMPFDEDTINYSKTKAEGPVTRLQDRIDKGEVKLRFDDAYG